MHNKTLKKALLISMALSTVSTNVVFAAEPSSISDSKIQNVASETDEASSETLNDGTFEETTEATESLPNDNVSNPDDSNNSETGDLDNSSTENSDPDTDNSNPDTDNSNPDDTNLNKPDNFGSSSAPETVPEEKNSSEAQTPDASLNTSTEAEEKNPEVTTNEPVTIIPSQIATFKMKPADFRFWTTVKKYAFSRGTVAIRENKNDSSKEVGTLHWKSVCYVLEDKNEDWVYIESGDVRGFVKKTDLFTGSDAENIVKTYQNIADEHSGKNNSSFDYLLKYAEKKVEITDNEAFDYLKSTTSQTVIAKKYALVNATLLNIREGKGTDTRIIGTIPQGALCYVIADENSDWVYIESGDVRGFVFKEYLDTSDNVKEKVLSIGEDKFTLASNEVEPSDNKALYYTRTSIKSGISDNSCGAEIVAYAKQFLGNPYVWGGTSLTDGADCSGFVQQIYSNFNIELPRVAEDQAEVGEKIPVSDAQPGDLIFYADETGYIYHVVIYSGDGNTVEAMNEDNGIVESKVLSDACWATRLVPQNTNYESIDIGTVTNETWEYLRNTGYSKVQTASIMANIWAESHFNPSIEEYGSGVGFGLCQWSYERRENLENYAASTGRAASDLQVQLEFLNSELNLNGFNGNTEYYNIWSTTSDVNEATEAFLYGWERPGVPRLAERIQAANVYYNAYIDQ